MANSLQPHGYSPRDSPWLYDLLVKLEKNQRSEYSILCTVVSRVKAVSHRTGDTEPTELPLRQQRLWSSDISAEAKDREWIIFKIAVERSLLNRMKTSEIHAKFIQFWRILCQHKYWQTWAKKDTDNTSRRSELLSSKHVLSVTETELLRRKNQEPRTRQQSWETENQQTMTPNQGTRVRGERATFDKALGSFPGGPGVTSPACSPGDTGSIPGLEDPAWHQATEHVLCIPRGATIEAHATR